MPHQFSRNQPIPVSLCRTSLKFYKIRQVLMDQFIYLIPIVIVLFFIGLWILILKILSVTSGWTKLAERYPYEQTFSGEYYRFQSAIMNKVIFRSSLNMGMDVMGLYLIPMVFFRLIHKPLFIQWGELVAEPVRRFMIQVYRLRFRSCGCYTDCL